MNMKNLSAILSGVEHVTEREKRQVEKFKEAARELECDDDEKRFEERLGELVRRKDFKHPKERLK